MKCGFHFEDFCYILFKSYPLYLCIWDWLEHDRAYNTVQLRFILFLFGKLPNRAGKWFTIKKIEKKLREGVLVSGIYWDFFFVCKGLNVKFGISFRLVSSAEFSTTSILSFCYVSHIHGNLIIFTHLKQGK